MLLLLLLLHLLLLQPQLGVIINVVAVAAAFTVAETAVEATAN